MKHDRDDLIQHEADQLAAEAFDRFPADVEQWVRDALVGEWGERDEHAAQHLIWSAVQLGVSAGPNDAGLVRLRRAVSQLRDAYVDHASERGLYAAEAEDAINCAASDEAERQRDIEQDRAVDAYQAGIRG